MDGLGRVAALGAAALLLCACGDASSDAPPDATMSETATSATDPVDPTPTAGSLADLPVGDPPQLAYVRAGESLVEGDRSTDLEWDVEAVTTGGLVWDADEGTIHRVYGDRIEVVASNASSPPVTDAAVTWIEGDAEVVRQYEPGEQDRQSLPAGCCAGSRPVGVDVDIDPDVVIAAEDGSWLWDTYEGREGRADPPPDSDSHFWPVGGLGSGAVVDTGISSEILVEYPGGEWGWGYVAGPRDPGSGEPVQYLEQERLRADRVWLASNAVLALDGGQLVVLETEPADDRGGHHWRELTGERSRLGLPEGVRLDGVVAEDRRTVLVDATDASGSRAWVRCHVGLLACAIAAELGPEDVVPQ